MELLSILWTEGEVGMKANEYFVPVRPLKVIHTREFVITNDGKTVATIQQDLYDRLRNVVADKYRVLLKITI